MKITKNYVMELNDLIYWLEKKESISKKKRENNGNEKAIKVGLIFSIIFFISLIYTICNIKWSMLTLWLVVISWILFLIILGSMKMIYYSYSTKSKLKRSQQTIRDILTDKNKEKTGNLCHINALDFKRGRYRKEIFQVITMFISGKITSNEYYPYLFKYEAKNANEVKSINQIEVFQNEKELRLISNKNEEIICLIGSYYNINKEKSEFHFLLLSKIKISEIQYENIARGIEGTIVDICKNYLVSKYAYTTDSFKYFQQNLEMLLRETKLLDKLDSKQELIEEKRKKKI